MAKSKKSSLSPAERKILNKILVKARAAKKAKALRRKRNLGS